MMEAAAAVAIDGGGLPLSGGLLALVRPALELLEPGGVLAVLSECRTLRQELPAWCRLERCAYVDCERMPDGTDRHLIVRGTSGPRRDWAGAAPLPIRDGRLLAEDVLAQHPMPARASAETGFAPRGAAIEPGGPAYPFSLVTREHVAPPEVGQLYDQAVATQWDATRDIPWRLVRTLPPPLESALAQVMTFLAENELSALYVPARFLPRIHPAYAEVAMFLATQLADEARHVDVFLKRARIAGSRLGVSSRVTARSLLSLLEVDDFSEATFLLSVLGEGTFLDLLHFVEQHAPDLATAELVRRARADESRHVHFGLAHLRQALVYDPNLYDRLEAAVRRRAAALRGAGGVPAPLEDALTVLAARGTEPRAIARGHEAFR